ncbi:MAG: hypothetical protein AMXMBFR13_43060 [Phycisphaerae bacterium]
MGSAPLKQTTCPVTGEPVKADSFTTFEGRKVFFCCDDCIEKFKKAPAKYLPALYKQVYPQRIQATCPVMGGAVDPEVSVEHEGHKVYFCCEGCDKKFKKEPAKYLAKLKESYTTQVHCPVTGNPIDLAQSLEEKDRTVYFCSEACIAKYKADPKKYAQALLPEVGVVAYGLTAKDDIVTAPVCPADKAQYRRGEVQSTVYRGKVYFLSSEACARAFNADPSRYVRGLNNTAAPPKSPVPARPQSSATPRPSRHPGHWDEDVHTGHPASIGGHASHAGGGGHGCSPGCH